MYDDFNNILASDEYQLSVRSMGDSHFTLSDGLVCESPIILLQKQVLLWDAPLLGKADDPSAVVMPNGSGWEAWTDEAWRVFEVASPRPEMVIFGTGKAVLPPPPNIRQYLNSLGIQVEAHDTRNACSTYNLLVEEERMVAAALLPNVRKPTKRVLSTEKPQQPALS